MILNLCLADEEIMRLNAMFKGMVVNNLDLQDLEMKQEVIKQGIKYLKYFNK